MTLAGEAIHAAARAAVLRLLEAEAAEAAQLAARLGVDAAELDLGLQDLFDPEAQRFAEEFVFQAIRSLTFETSERVRAVILDATRRGAGVDEAALLVRDVTGAEAWRVHAIARTELNRAANWGRYAGWRRSGLVHTKEYLATRDGRVRETHLAADGERVPLDAPFTRGAAAGKLMPPVEPNCRCTAVPVTRFTGLAGAARRRPAGSGAVVRAIPGLRRLEDERASRLRAAWRTAWRDAYAREWRDQGNAPLLAPLLAPLVPREAAA